MDADQQAAQQAAHRAAQQAFEVDVNRVNRAIAYSAGPQVQQIDEYQLNERIALFVECFCSADRNHRLILDGTPDERDRQRLMDEFGDLRDRYSAAMAIYRRRVAELAPLQAPPANANAAAAAANNQVQAIPLPDGANNENAPGVQAQQAPAVNNNNNDANAQANGPAQQPDGQNQQQVPLNAAPQVQPGVPAGMQINLTLPLQPHQVANTWGKFDGNPLKWFDFKQRFQLAVHNVDALPLANKMAYLRDALDGEAAAAMQGYGIDPVYYQDFWNALVLKYEQRYTLACAYLSHFFGLRQLDGRASASDLRKLSNETNGLLRQLRELHYQIDQWDLVIVHALQERLGPVYQPKWQAVRNNNDAPTIAMMTGFLDEQANLIANQGLVYQPLQVIVSNERAQRPHGGAIQRQPPNQPGAKGGQVYPCGICGSMSHLPPTCPEFRPLTYDDRVRIATIRRVCFNCLKRGHGKAQCFDLHRCREEACRRDNAHNSMLCPVKNQPEYVQVVQRERSDAYAPPPPVEYRMAMTPGTSDGRSSTSNPKPIVSGRGRGTSMRHPWQPQQ